MTTSRLTKASTIVVANRSHRLRRCVAISVLAMTAGVLASGCQGSAAKGGNGSPTTTVATVSTSTTTTTTTVTARTGQSGTPKTLPSCGSNRDPFDPSGAQPPAGSPARC